MMRHGTSETGMILPNWLTKRSVNDAGKEPSQRRPLGCFARGLIALLIALLVFVAITVVLPFILNLPTGDERQIMNEVKRLGGNAWFPHMSPAGCYVDLRHLKVTDRDLALLDLGRSKILWRLDLRHTSVGDPGMKYVAQISSLRYLYLIHTRVTDAGIAQLVSLPHLQMLNLSDTQVTDAAVPDIARMRSLTDLAIENTGITDSGFEKLTAALPKCSVYRGAKADAEAVSRAKGK